MNLPVPLQTWLPGSSPYGGVQSEAGAGIQCLCYSDGAHRALQGCPLLSQTHQGKSHFLLVYFPGLTVEPSCNFSKKKVWNDLEINDKWRLSGTAGVPSCKMTYGRYLMGNTWEDNQNVLLQRQNHSQFECMMYASWVSLETTLSHLFGRNLVYVNYYFTLFRSLEILVKK